MLYLTRNRYKEAVTAADLPKYNQIIDTAILPAIQNVQGVRAAHAYTSISGDLVFLIEIADLATVDRILIDPGCKQALGQIYDAIVRIGGEVLYDRPQWQGIYGRS